MSFCDVTIVAIPDGAGTAPGSLRLSGVLTPVRGSTIDLADFPGAMNALLQRGVGIRAGSGAAVKATLYPNWPTPEALPAAQKIWKRIFGGYAGALDEVICLDSDPSSPAKPRPGHIDAFKHLQAAQALTRIKTDHLEIHSNLAQHLSNIAEASLQVEPPKLMASVGHLLAARFDAQPFRHTAPDYFKQVANDLIPDAIRGDAVGRFAARQPAPNQHARIAMQDFGKLQFNATAFAETGTLDKTYSKAVGTSLVKHIEAHDNANPIQPTDNSSVMDDKDFVRHMLAAIRSYPTLARFLGLTIDVEFDRAALTRRGAIALHIEGIDDTNCKYTAFQLDTTFVPASAGSNGNGEIPIQSGVAILDASRFAIGRIDSELLLRSMVQNASSKIEAASNGATADPAADRLPETQSRGLYLLDQKADDANRKRAEGIVAKLLGTPQTPFCAEHLCIGYRPDVERTRQKDGQPPQTDEWRSLTARKIVFPEIWTACGLGDGKSHPYTALSERDHGLVRRMTKVVSTGNGSEANVASQMVFVWKGDHLGLAVVTDETQRVTRIPRSAGLPISLEMDFADDDKAPVLRHGDGYRFGMRAVMANGASVPLAKNTTYTAPNSAIGGSDSKPEMFSIVEDTHAPQLLLPDDDPLALGRTMRNLKDDRIVLYSGDTVRRFLVPARRTFEIAEQAGLFDVLRGGSPPIGAFADYMRDEYGNFPAFSGGTQQAADSKLPVAGRVLKSAPPLAVDRHPYYPDPYGRNVGIGFERDGKTPAGYPAPQNATFWENPLTALDAHPIEMQFWASANPGVTASTSGTTMTFQIGPGEQAHVWYWAYPDPETYLKLHHVGRSLTKGEAPANQVAALNFLAQKTPFNGLSGWSRLEFVHAVMKPGEISLPEPLLMPALPPENGSGTADQTKALFQGAVKFDRLNTKEVRFDVAWYNWKDCPTTIENGKHVFKPVLRRETVSGEIASIPIDCTAGAGRNGPAMLDVGIDESGKKRNISFDFHDSAAQQVAVRASAISRHTEEFTGKLASDFVVESTPFEDGASIDWSKASNRLSTARPPAPVVSRVEWLDVETSELKGSVAHTIRKKSAVRLYLTDYFVQGAGEQIAVVFARGDGEPSGKLVGNITHWAADPTVRGRDLPNNMSPQRIGGYQSSKSGVPLPDSDALNAKADPTRHSLADLLLFEIKPDGRTNEAYIEVTLDMGAVADEGPVSMPFVWLALARYQASSLNGLELSPVRVLDPIQPPAQRIVNIVRAGSSLCVVVEGEGYMTRDVSTLDRVSPDERPLVLRPLLNARLLRHAGGGRPLATVDDRGRRTQGKRVDSAAYTDLFYMLPDADCTGSGVRWSFVVELPDSDQLAIQLDEVELHIPDTEPGPLLRRPDPDAGLPENTPSNWLVEKPGMFSVFTDVPSG